MISLRFFSLLQVSFICTHYKIMPGLCMPICVTFIIFSTKRFHRSFIQPASGLLWRWHFSGKRFGIFIMFCPTSNFVFINHKRYIYVCHAPLARIFLTMPKVRRSIFYIFLAAVVHQSTRFFDT